MSTRIAGPQSAELVGFRLPLVPCRPTDIRAWVPAALAALILGLAPVARGQDAKPPAGIAPIEQRVDAFVAAVEARRKELGVVGAALVVAQGDRIVRIAGLGMRSLEPPLPVTEDTAFAIGSVTKMFTAMAVALAVGEGKLAFEDHPRRFVPSFRLQDPEADAKLNLIDLLAHRSGLDRSDLTFLLAPFTQAEMFELAARAKPAAKLRERFLYNNTMVALAGAVVARAYDTTYERFIAERFFKPLGMQASTVTRAGLLASPARAVGYSGASGAPKPERTADLAAIAGAGAINSTARDMGAWLRFLNARGQFAALRVSPAAFARVFEPHQTIGQGNSYGLGFFLETRSGVLIASHGGNVPGYSAHLVHVPDRALSFALLTNLTATALPSAAQELFWEHVVRPEIPTAAAPPSRPEPPPTAAPASPIAPERLPGTYFATAKGTFEVKKAESGLVAIFAGQPPYPLKAAGTNAYSLEGLSGFSITFAESTALPGRITALLRQPPSHPGGNVVYLKKDAVWLDRARAQYGGPGAELIGFYHSADRAVLMEIAPYRQGIALVITGVPLRALISLGGDAFRLEGLPETYRLTVRRTNSKRASGFVFEQPGVRIEMAAEVVAAVGDTAAAARAILDRAVAAAGGAAVLDRLESVTSLGRASAPTHGIDGRAEDRIVVGRRASLLELGAFGKFVIKTSVFTNARQTRIVTQQGDRIVVTGKGHESMRFFAVPHPLYRWQQRFSAVALAGETAVNGETAHVVELAPPGLPPSRLYISTATHLILREEMPSYEGDQLQSSPTSLDYSDYRLVGDVRLPFTIGTSAPGLGRITMAFDSISFDAPIDPKVFDGP